MGHAVGITLDRTYVLHEQLGEGGMGTVYRASHRLTGRTVAVKLVRGTGGKTVVSPAGRSSTRTSESIESRLALAREFQVLASLHHPNIVQVLDYGFDDTWGPYLSMELLSSPQSIVAASCAASPAIKFERLAQLLRALFYLHRRGVIHCDLKPSNVLCIGGQIKVVDFGIALSGECQRNLAGTLFYMAPELLLGAEPSVASDLYAFGVLAHQLLTGVFPYDVESVTGMVSDLLGTRGQDTLSGEAAAFLEAHRGTYPERELLVGATYAADDLAAPVRAVLSRLLQREPADRYPDALAVLRELSAATGLQLAEETEATRESFLLAAALVGREQELARLRAALHDTESGRGGTWLVGGESGIGKSRLVDELRTLALVQGIPVLRDQADADGGEHYALWRAVLRSLCLRSDPPAELAAILAELLPDLAELLERTLPPAPPVPPEARQPRLFAAILAVCQLVARPIVIVLDDLQWADADSLALLAHLASAAPTRPWLLIGTYRDDEAPTLAQKLPLAHDLRLQRLDDSSVAALATSMLGPECIHPAFAEYLRRESEGNVFVLIEVVRALAQEAGQLARIAAGALPAHILTGGIVELVERRVRRLTATERQILEAAAVVGRRVDLSVLGEMFPGTDLRTWLMTCANAAVLDAYEGGWRFSHDKLRGHLLAVLPTSKRQSLHSQIATVLEHLEAGRDDSEAQIGYHAEQAGEFRRAATYYSRAGDVAARRAAPSDSVAQYARAESMLANLPITAALRRERADLMIRQVEHSLWAARPQDNLMRLAHAEQELAAAAVDVPPGPADLMTLARAHFWRGRISYVGGHSPAARTSAQRALELAKELGAAELTAKVLFLSGQLETVRGDFRRGAALLAQCMEPLDRSGVAIEAIRARVHYAVCISACGRCVEGFAEARRAVAAAEAYGHAGLIAITHVLAAGCFFFAGDFATMEPHVTAALARAQQGREPVARFLAAAIHAMMCAYGGRPEQARPSLLLQEEILRAAGGSLLCADWFRATQAQSVFCAGDLDLAIAQAREVAAHCQLEERLFAWGLTERTLAEALARKGEAADGEVDAHFAQSRAAFELGGAELLAAHTDLAWGRACAKRGDHARAQKLLTQALAQFTASASLVAGRAAQQALDSLGPLPAPPSLNN